MLMLPARMAPNTKTCHCRLEMVETHPRLISRGERVVRSINGELVTMKTFGEKVMTRIKISSYNMTIYYKKVCERLKALAEDFLINNNL